MWQIHPDQVLLSNALYTPTAFKDCAGDIIYKAEQNGAATYRSFRFDFADDIDYYEIVPNTTKDYYITTSLTSSAYDTDLVLYDHTGNVLASSVGSENATVNYHLVAGTKHYIKVLDANNNVADYTLIVNGGCIYEK